MSGSPDGKHKAPIEQYEGIEPAPLPPIAPDGGLMPGPIGSPPSVPAATPKTFVCLRGPCRHYWELVTFMAAGNPSGTFGEDGLRDPDTGKPIALPRQINRTCLAHPGTETELTEDMVYDCNLWDPIVPGERLARDKNRRRYLKAHPEHRPTTEENTRGTR